MIVFMLVIYVIGALSSWVYNRIMVSVSCGVLYKVRNQMFEHMQRLPIKYFDTHSHGDVMSRYTNDTDSLRMMMMSQSVPQLISSLLTVISVFYYDDYSKSYAYSAGCWYAGYYADSYKIYRQAFSPLL